ncbi:MAG TPA: cbb3-type cytochrome c oxidase subunit II [Chloroflexota bacterium]|jgi:cytochrome c oxidase cbb3-type subunit 2|nr:cbb3-type cytochrome c oxidase subunit II [Chloroflexota bacterium]
MNIPGELWRLAAGSGFFLALGMGATILLPSTFTPPPSGLATRYTPQQLHGRQIYLREGCWYCHTQQVRPTEANQGTVYTRGDIGPVSKAGDYAYQKPVFWGTERQGPDLSHVASRVQSAQPAWELAHLEDPAALVPGTIMPSYGHLPQSDLQDLVDYLLTLK